jgi:hypothetical protein
MRTQHFQQKEVGLEMGYAGLFGLLGHRNAEPYAETKKRGKLLIGLHTMLHSSDVSKTISKTAKKLKNTPEENVVFSWSLTKLPSLTFENLAAKARGQEKMAVYCWTCDLLGFTSRHFMNVSAVDFWCRLPLGGITWPRELAPRRMMNAS